MTLDEVKYDIVTKGYYMNDEHIKVSWETKGEGGEPTRYKFYIEDFYMEYNLATNVPLTSQMLILKTKVYMSVPKGVWNTMVKDICDKRDNIKKLQAKI